MLRELCGKIFPPSVGAYTLDLLASLHLSPSLKAIKSFNSVRLVLEIVRNGETGLVIDEASDVQVTFSNRRCAHWSIKIGVNQLKDLSSTLL